MKNSSAFKSICMVFLVLFILVFFNSCATGPSQRRGSLSEAMDKARDDHEGSRTVPSKPVRPNPPENHPPRRPPSTPVDDPQQADDIKPKRKEPLHIWYGVRGGNSEIVSGDFGSRSDGDFLLSAHVDPQVKVALYAGYKAAYPRIGTNLHASIKDSLIILKAGLEMRWQPLPNLPIFSPYIGGQLGAFFMAWEFRNALSTPDGDISSDSLSGIHLACGFGAYILNLERFRLGASIYPETMLFAEVTNQGFDNDFFAPLGTIRLAVELMVQY